MAEEKTIAGVACPACTGDVCSPIVLTGLTGRGSALMALAHCRLCGILFMPGSGIEKGILDEYDKAVHSKECSYCGEAFRSIGARKKHERYFCLENPERRAVNVRGSKPGAVGGAHRGAGAATTARYGCTACNHTWVADYEGERPGCPECEEEETYAIARFDRSGGRVVLKKEDVK